MPMFGKKKKKLLKTSVPLDDSISLSKPKKKNGLKRLIPSRSNASSNIKLDSHIGEIAKPIIASSTANNGKKTFNTDTTPIKENRRTSSLSNTPNTVGSSDTIDSDNTEPHESPNGFEVRGDQHPVFTVKFQEYLQMEQQQLEGTHFGNKKLNTEKDHMQRLKETPKEKSLPKVDSNSKANKTSIIRNETRALGDDLTVSTVRTGLVNDNEPSIYVPQFPQMSISKSSSIDDGDHNQRNSLVTHPTKKDVFDDQRRKEKLINLTRSALRRASNRFSLPTHLAKRWSVEISPPIKDPSTSQYTFSISIRENRGKLVASSDKVLGPPTATTKRTLQDFCWLEQALRNEFHGALLVPLLSMSLGSNGWLSQVSIEEWNNMPSLKAIDAKIGKMQDEKTKESKKGGDKSEKKESGKVPIEKVMSNWLSDILNGVRGRGELIMHVPNLDVFSSESMETFLYRNTDPLPKLPFNQSQLQYFEDREFQYFDSDTTGLQSTQLTHKSNNNSKDTGFLKEIVHNSISCFVPAPEQKEKEEAINKNATFRGSSINLKSGGSPLTDILNCSSRQNGNAVDKSDQHTVISDLSQFSLTKKEMIYEKKLPQSSRLAIHSELISAQSDLILHYRKVTLRCLSQIRHLLNEEEQRNNAWKRFAIALTNLFAYEKDIELAKVGENIKSSPITNGSPKTTISKSMLESGLRHLSRQKRDRTSPSLKVLNCMLEAYFEDLSMIEPSLVSHTASMKKISVELSLLNSSGQENGHNMNQRWDFNLKQLSQKLSSVTQHLTGANNSTKSLNTLATAELSDSTHGSGSQANPAYKRAVETKILMNEDQLKKSMNMLIKSLPIRFARMAWTFFKLESAQSSLLKAKAIKLRTEISHGTTIGQNEPDQCSEEKTDDEYELGLVEKVLSLGDAMITENASALDTSEVRMRAIQCEKVMRLARERVGRWNAGLAMAVMEAAGVEDAEVRVEEFTRDLRIVRKHAIGLREKVERCVEAVEALMVVTIGDVNDMEENIEVMDADGDTRGLKRTVSMSSSYEPSSISAQTPLCQKSRYDLLSNLALVFSGALVEPSVERSRKGLPSSRILSRAGINTGDSTGWLSALKSEHRKALRISPTSEQRGNCGKVAASYFQVRDANVSSLLSQISRLLRDYIKRVEGIESFVYMHCVGIQLEKHFGKSRVKLVQAWEKKTDITTAINIATKKGVPQLVEELNTKRIAMSYVSQTVVKQAKDKHLTSKSIKNDLEDLANRRFQRDKESATKRATSIIQLWLEHEENVALEEMKALGESIREIERTVTEEDIKADGGPHLFAFIE